jgi:glycosyltransferase involved in cell wall biosynthesis
MSLHIAITADPYLPVPPRFYGGIERVIDLLVRGLADRGHHITLFAHPDSRTAGDLRPYGSHPHSGHWRRAQELWAVGAGLWQTRRRVDVVHSFGRLAAMLPILPLRGLPKIQSYQREVPWRGVRRATRLAGDTLCFTGCSSRLYADAARQGASAAQWRTIFNGVDLTRYTPVARVPDDAPLMFLGRLERIKGPHHAIAIARAAKRPLVLAGNIPDRAEDAAFYHREVAPHVDGQHVAYIGPVDDAQKNVWLGRAAALLMPIEWDEPFGIVMAEALACGTPVIGFGRGSVPEVVRHGVNGFIGNTVAEAAAFVPQLWTLDRDAIRIDCSDRFGHEATVTAYERLYLEMTGA